MVGPILIKGLIKESKILTLFSLHNSGGKPDNGIIKPTETENSPLGFFAKISKILCCF